MPIQPIRSIVRLEEHDHSSFSWYHFEVRRNSWKLRRIETTPPALAIFAKGTLIAASRKCLREKFCQHRYHETRRVAVQACLGIQELMALLIFGPTWPSNLNSNFNSHLLPVV